jgi:hypothetical protein
MGMFDKDKEIGIILNTWTSEETPFILWEARIIREDFPTNLGPAVQAELVVSKLDAPQDRYKVTTLGSAITSKVREAEADDFPAIVQTKMVDTKWGRDALVLSFLKPYDGPGSHVRDRASRPVPDDQLIRGDDYSPAESSIPASQPDEPAPF